MYGVMAELGYDPLSVVILTSGPRLRRHLELEVRIRVAKQLAAQSKAAQTWREGKEGREGAMTT